MNCPACRSPLIVVEREGIELDHCPRCRGIWFDEGELALLAERIGRILTLEASVRPLAGPAGEQFRRCPRCRRRMAKEDLGSAPRIGIDRCRRGHGLWFDSGELGALMSQMPGRPGSHPEALLRFAGETLQPSASRGGDPGGTDSNHEEGDR